MTEFISKFFLELWRQLCLMSPALLLGFLFAGIISTFMSPDYIKKHLGGNGIWPIIKAALIGVPLPLCSCGVLPVGAALRKQGASKGSVTSFMISTPQTGVDSILVTYSMLGVVFAIFRPFVAFFSGVLGGFLVGVFDKEKSAADSEKRLADVQEDTLTPEGHETAAGKIYQMLHYAFVDLMDVIAQPFLIGLFIAAAISLAVPDNWFSTTLGSGILPMFFMMLLGIPLYVCATASVPVAAAFIAKGVSPGAALVFLVVGPAVNAAAVATIVRILGKRSALIYLFSLAASALLAGFAIDSFYSLMPSDIKILTAGHDCCLAFWEKVSGIALGIMIFLSIFRRRITPLFRKKSVDSNTLVFNVPEMNCAHCLATVKCAMEKIECISGFDIDLPSKTVIVKMVNSADREKLIDHISSALKKDNFTAVFKD